MENETKKAVKNTKTSKSNLIKFKNAPTTILTENEINNLFLGFVNLIKRNVVFEKEKSYKRQILSYQNQISEIMQDLQRKEFEIMELKEKISLQTQN